LPGQRGIELAACEPAIKQFSSFSEKILSPLYATSIGWKRGAVCEDAIARNSGLICGLAGWRTVVNESQINAGHPCLESLSENAPGYVEF
jgi:hypothetical protein